MANKLEKLPIYPKAVAFSVAVTALLDRPAFGKNYKLRDRIDGANDSILSNMAEGFEQPTDKAVEKFSFVAKGSAAEVLTHLGTARRKGFVTAEAFVRCKTMGEELQRMLGGWIKYLARSNWKDRGRHGYGIRDSGFGIRDSGFGIRDSRFGIRDTGSGIRD